MNALRHVSNDEIARTLSEIGEYLAMQDVPFKPRAYERAAQAIGGLEEDIHEIYKNGGIRALMEIPGVGASIAEHIKEYLCTGRIKHYEALKKKMPINLRELNAIEGLGPKSIKRLYTALGTKDLKTLKEAARAGKIAHLSGFGEKSEENILKGIEFVKHSSGRFSLGSVMPLVRTIEKRLSGIGAAERVTVAGSVRRRKETIGDIDMLVVARNPKSIMDFFVSMPEVAHVYTHGITKSSVKLSSGIDIDLRVVARKSYGAALHYFTGSKDHNVALRQIAIKKGYKLNEYGLFRKRDGRVLAGETEDGVYKKLGFSYIEPELREMTGEIERAAQDTLPALVGYNDLAGDLQVQTDWTDGAHSIEKMAHAAVKLGLHYIAITDHTKRLAMTHGLDERRIVRQWNEIDRVNRKLKGKIKVLKGTECDILKNGDLDLPQSVLSRLDIVGVSVHSYFTLSQKEQTERIVRAMQNPHVDILFHPTGRVLQKRKPYEVDMKKIVAIARKTGTVLEIDAHPDRLDLKDEHIRMCVNSGVKMSIDSDAHAAGQMAYVEYGIAQARRGWAAKSDIINTRPLAQMLKLLKH